MSFPRKGESRAIATEVASLDTRIRACEQILFEATTFSEWFRSDSLSIPKRPENKRFLHTLFRGYDRSDEVRNEFANPILSRSSGRSAHARARRHFALLRALRPLHR